MSRVFDGHWQYHFQPQPATPRQGLSSRCSVSTGGQTDKVPWEIGVIWGAPPIEETSQKTLPYFGKIIGLLL